MMRYRGLLLLLLTAGCASARSSPHAVSSGGQQCAANLVMYRGQVAKALAEKAIDQPVYDDQQRRIAKIAAICAAGDGESANALLLDAAIGLSLGADDAHARLLNKAN